MDKNNIITILGLIAGGLTTFSVVPEVYAAYSKMSKAKMQHSTLFLFLIGNILWVIYAYNVKDYILLLYTSIASILFSSLFLTKFIF
ncbi:hypothetical protein N9O88_01215 [bacterium]|nr:hypothetical protein [bacterium]